jgi:hypothetical protein
MSGAPVLYQLARADFLERVRRHSFLIALGLTAYFCYICLPPNHADYVTLQIAGHRGVYNSAYVGTLVAMQTATILSLAGFYLVKNAVDRDLQTGVGQILATTPLTKRRYLLGKASSNFAVLVVMVAVLAVAAAAMQIARGEDRAFHPVALLLPFLIIDLPVAAAVSGVAVLFEVIPWLRRGLGNVVYFFLWGTVLGLTAEAITQSHPAAGADMLAFGAVIPSILATCEAYFPGCASSPNFSMGFNFGAAGRWDLTTFPWTGVAWSASILIARLVWFAAGAGCALLASIWFDRFDPSREWNRRAATASATQHETEQPAPKPIVLHPALSRLRPGLRRFRFLPLVRAELRLAVKGLGRWWYIVAFILLLGGLVSPLAISRLWLIGAWIWPILIWSAMGTREARYGTAPFIFATAHPLRRQLPACWFAGVAVALFTGLGPAARMLLARDLTGLGAWAVGVLFIPTLALALGVWSGSSKLFEVIYMLLWYVGPANRFAPFDYMNSSGNAPQSGTPLVFLIATVLLAAAALLGRKRQLSASRT